MKILFDSNVWLSGLIARGLCADLLRIALQRHGHGDFELLLCAGVRDEVLRILHDKLKATAAGLDAARAAMATACEIADGTWQPPADFPVPDDAPIIAAALAARADLFVTGDKALLALGTAQGLPIIAPRDAYQRLRGLA
ncbi:MAG: putative toxin-antitoxin system toxin component, PIN family [Xanthomonadaceae bacterium]|nr:putative toxin-antitoxin system toxin component, PIN family [Xanthomonadaceae bacterium]MDP2186423.1 putative toxin-antitoxin system toxin component, PIN family [Xanthomonadales bacterium]MDZ4115465.1 putative toxin-antitoxin system toxin component, PIN family [Xanthomonadaceae bacterium]MDZ4376954.1 putative toxin-antitoxin system toxin component, PIN family [Xanthomonadaceae bacterium]